MNKHDQDPLLAQLTGKVPNKVDQVGHNLLTAMLKRVWIVLQHHNRVKRSYLQRHPLWTTAS